MLYAIIFFSFSVPSAVQAPARQPIQYRNERLVNGGPNSGFLRIRRPLAAAQSRPTTLQSLQSQNSLIDEAKPVTEESESGEAPSFIPQAQPLVVQTPKPQLPAILYSTDENGEILDQHRPQHEPFQQQHDFSHDFSTTPRFNQPIQQQEHIAPTTLRTTSNAQRFSLNHDSRLIQNNPKPVNMTFPLNFHFLCISS